MDLQADILRYLPCCHRKYQRLAGSTIAVYRCAEALVLLSTSYTSPPLLAVINDLLLQLLTSLTVKTQNETQKQSTETAMQLEAPLRIANQAGVQGAVNRRIKNGAGSITGRPGKDTQGWNQLANCRNELGESPRQYTSTRLMSDAGQV